MFYTNVKSDYKGINLTYVRNGQRKITKLPFKPKLYTPCNMGEFIGLDGVKLKEHKFETIRDYNKFLRDYKGLENFSIYGEINPEYQFIQRNWVDDIKFDKKLINIAYFDIEVSPLSQSTIDKKGALDTTNTPFPIVSIALYHSINDTMVVFGLKEYDIDKSPHKDKFKIIYKRFGNETELLKSFMNHITNENFRPDIFVGWNSTMYDIPYIINRYKRVGGDKFKNALSPFEQVTQYTAKKKKFGKWEEYEAFDIKGITHIDGIDAYQVFGGRPQQSSYALNHIGEEEVNQKKLEYNESKHILETFWDNHQVYIDYNIQDTYLVKLIDDKVRFTDRIIQTAFKSRCNFSDVLGTTKQWDIILYNYITSKGMIIPPLVEREKIPYSGGFVRNSLVGSQKWVTTFDFKSMYPYILMVFNMSPETILKEFKDGCITTPNRLFFKNDVIGVIPSMINDLLQDREKFKKLAKEYYDNKELHEYYDVNQYVIKILLNSLYGALGNRFFRYYTTELAEGVTKTGQYLIKRMADCLNKCLNQINKTTGQEYTTVNIEEFEQSDDAEDFVVMGDTDSCAISFEKYVKENCQNMTDRQVIDKILELYTNIIDPAIENELNMVYDEFNITNKSLKLQLESISKQAIYLVKKHYIGHILYEDGKYFLDEEEPKLKIKGVEGVKSSTPKFFRQKLKEFYKIAVLKDEKYFREFMENTLKSYRTQEVMTGCKPIKASNLDKWKCDKNIYISGTGEQAKACLIYNHFLKMYKLENTYDLIKDGDSVHLLKLTQPNPLRTSCIAIPNGHIPKEFKLDNYVGDMIHYEKYFLKPVSNISKILKWNANKRKVLL